MRHAGLIVKDMEAEIAFFELLGYHKISHQHEEWAHRRLEVVKMSRETDDEFFDLMEPLIELVKPITGEWSPHVALDVDAWPKGIVVRHLGEPADDSLEVGFAVSPSGNVVEMVKKK